jgi:hypothetical protein
VVVKHTISKVERDNLLGFIVYIREEKWTLLSGFV